MCKTPTVNLQELIYSFFSLQSTSKHKLAKPENRTYKDDLSVRLFVLFGLNLHQFMLPAYGLLDDPLDSLVLQVIQIPGVHHLWKYI
jgi:hypothetical protein